MVALIKFIKRTALVFLALFLSIGALVYYAEQPQDYKAFDCINIKSNKNSPFMVRKKPFDDNVQGLYASPTKSPNFSLNDDITDLHLVGVERLTNKDWILFEFENLNSHFVRLGRQSLNLIIGKFNRQNYEYNPNPDKPAKIELSFECKIISNEDFYRSIRANFDREKGKLKI